MGLLDYRIGGRGEYKIRGGEVKMSEIEIYVQGKRFVAKNIEEVDEFLNRFNPWNILEVN